MDDGIVFWILVGESDPSAQLADQYRYSGTGELLEIDFPELGEYVPFVYRPVLSGHGMPEVLEVLRGEDSGFEHRPNHVRLVQMPGNVEELFGSEFLRAHG